MRVVYLCRGVLFLVRRRLARGEVPLCVPGAGRLFASGEPKGDILSDCGLDNNGESTGDFRAAFFFILGEFFGEIFSASRVPNHEFLIFAEVEVFFDSAASSDEVLPCQLLRFKLFLLKGIKNQESKIMNQEFLALQL